MTERHEPFQFGLANMFAATAAAALIAWLLAAEPLSLVVFSVFTAIAAGLLIGIVVCATTEMGDLSLGTASREALKCFAVAGAITAAGVGLFQLAPQPVVFVALFPLFYIALKICWRDLNKFEFAVILFWTLVALAVIIGLIGMAIGPR